MLYGQTQWGIEQYGQGPDTTAPALRNQSPAPGETQVAADVAPYLEIFDAGQLVASSVRIYLDGTICWSGARYLSGFSGTRAAVSDGYSYSISIQGLLEPGVHTIRATASDGAGNAMDSSYSFTTRVYVPDAADEAAIRQEVGFDLLLDSSHDVETEDYDLRLVAGVDELVQRLLVRLRLFFGDWYLDDEAGVQYYSSILVNNPSSRVIEAALRQEIMAEDDVEALKSFELEIDRASRELSMSFEAVSSVGVVDASATVRL